MPAELDQAVVRDDRNIAPLEDPDSATSADVAYTVRKADTYWTIAEDNYGSGAYFKAIYEHNRRHNRSADRLQAGSRLLLPDEATLQRLYPTLCPKTRKVAQNVATQVSAVRVDGRTYNVAEGDTLYEIARRELGKSSRWAEIHELNRETLGDDVRPLVPGTQLILPRHNNAKATGPASRR
jgi:nucleoid-associated protein YgaU